MSRRLAALALAALVLSISAGCADDVSPALRVGDVKIGDDAMLHEMDEWAGNSKAIDASQLTGPPGTYPQGLAAFIIQQRLEFVLHNEQFEELDLQLDDEVRIQALTLLFQGDPSVADEAFAEFSDGYTTDFVDDTARRYAVESSMGEEQYLAWRAEVLSDTDIEVSPRYGSWDPETGQILPPDGPLQPTPDIAPLGP